jgi:hypothetical protein
MQLQKEKSLTLKYLEAERRCEERIKNVTINFLILTLTSLLLVISYYLILQMFRKDDKVLSWEENTKKKLLSNCTIYEIKKRTVHDNYSKNVNQCVHFCRLVSKSTHHLCIVADRLTVYHLL